MKNFLKDLEVSVIGLGRSGAAAANLARSFGADVLISDISKTPGLAGKYKLSKGIKTEFGRHSKKILDSDLIIKSPGVHNDLPILLKAHEKNIPVWGEIELASKFINPKMIFAVTGTNGKTTVTSLLGEIVKRSGQKTVVAGNIGRPLASMAGIIDSKTTVVLEVSSYQLEDSFCFHPNVCSVLNVTSDHLEHHHTMTNYIGAKKRLFMNQNREDFCILNYDDPACRKIAGVCPSNIIYFSRKEYLSKGVSFTNGRIRVNVRNSKYVLNGPFKIPGLHNVENIMAAAAMASAGGISSEAVKKAVAQFTGVEHRIEFVTEAAGVKYYNDSKGTNVDSTRVALESFDNNIWLILGGRDKGSPYRPIANLVRKKVKGVLLIGEAAAKIRKELSGTADFYDCQTLKNAVKRAAQLSRPGDIVLLSPACASFDQFKDYEDRGRQFKAFVRGL